MTTTRTLAMLLALSLSAACGSSSSSTDAAPKTDGSNALHDASADASTSCAPPGFAPTVSSITVTSANATIVDLSSTPINGMNVSVTGLDISYPGTTASNGQVNVAPDHALMNPAFRFGDGLTTVELAVKLTAASTAIGTLKVGSLPVSGATMTAGSTAVSGGVTLTFAADTTITVDSLEYATADAQKFRAVALPIADEQQVVASAPTSFDLMFGVAPLETIFCPKAQVSVANSESWPAGAAVSFYQLGLDVRQSWEPYGGWTKTSAGAVSTDGLTISTSATGGLPTLDNFAIALGN